VQVSPPLVEQDSDSCTSCEYPTNFLDPVVLAMNNPERRQTPRTTIATHAYINIEPNNGGIVLNVSDGGLCFHSFDPVQRNGGIHFWFSDHNRRIEGNGALAWMDETQKGGLRFAALPPEAREQIRKWMIQSATVLATGEVPVPVGPQPRTFPVPSTTWVETKVAPAVPFPSAAASEESRAPKPLSGFSRGLATGLLVSAVVIAAFLFQSYRREFGETLIRLGERFAAKPPAQTLAMPAATPVALPGPPAPQVVAQAAAPIPDAPPKQTLPAGKPVRHPQKADSEPEVVTRTFVSPVKPQPSRLEPARPTTTPAPTSADPSGAKPPARTPAPAAASSTPPTSSLPVAALASTSNVVPPQPSPAAKIEPAKQPEVQTTEISQAAENPNSTSELFFEVGKFKNQSQAHVEIDKLSQLGFPATAVQKGFLWTNSYHVLVGPYGDEDRAKATHKNLVSNGFKPRPFERGSRAFTLNTPVTLNGARTPPGDYILSWESYLDDASVKFLHNDFTVATANGRWVKRDVKYPRDAYVYKRNADGSRTLLEIRFGGTRQALVFGKSS